MSGSSRMVCVEGEDSVANVGLLGEMVKGFQVREF